MPEIDLGRIRIIKALMDKGLVPGDVGVSPQGTFYPNPQTTQAPRNSMFSRPSSPVTQAPIVEAQVPSQAPMSIPIEPQARVSEPTSQKSTFFRDVILPMLPSLIATGVGTAVPGALAGAAGFSQGYAEGFGKEKDRQTEILKKYLEDNQLEDVYEVKNGQLKSIGKVRKKDRVVQPREDILGQLVAAETPSSVETGKQVQDKFVKPANIPQSVWDSTTEQQKQEYFNSINGR